MSKSDNTDEVKELFDKYVSPLQGKSGIDLSSFSFKDYLVESAVETTAGTCPDVYWKEVMTRAKMRAIADGHLREEIDEAKKFFEDEILDKEFLKEHQATLAAMLLGQAIQRQQDKNAVFFPVNNTEQVALVERIKVLASTGYNIQEIIPFVIDDSVYADAKPVDDELLTCESNQGDQ